MRRVERPRMTAEEMPLGRCCRNPRICNGSLRRLCPDRVPGCAGSGSERTAGAFPNAFVRRLHPLQRGRSDLGQNRPMGGAESGVLDPCAPRSRNHRRGGLRRRPLSVIPSSRARSRPTTTLGATRTQHAGPRSTPPRIYRWGAVVAASRRPVTDANRPVFDGRKWSHLGDSS